MKSARTGKPQGAREAPGPGAKGKGRIRALVQRGAKSTKGPRVAQKISVRDPTVCDRCGAVYQRKSWRRGRALSRALLDRAGWGICPACTQVDAGEYYGRIVSSGDYVAVHGDAIRRRIRNVARQAATTQPERKLVSIDAKGEQIEVLTTSQKLAHRIAKELVKAFGGQASYSWSDRDGNLLATWQR